MCKRCKNSSKMAAVGKVKKRKSAATKRRTTRRRSRVSGMGDVFNIEELALVAAGALAAKMLVNPLGKVIFKGKEESERPKYFPLIMKVALAFGLTKLDMKEADDMAKGAALAAVLEGAEMFAPTIFKPQIKGSVDGYDDDYLADNVELNLSDINGYGDDDMALAGYGDDDMALAGYGDDGAVAGGVM